MGIKALRHRAFSDQNAGVALLLGRQLAREMRLSEKRNPIKVSGYGG
jgi:hypothetical protein